MYYWRSVVLPKIGLILSLIKKVDNIIIVGAMANNFLKFQGHKVGGHFWKRIT